MEQLINGAGVGNVQASFSAITDEAGAPLPEHEQLANDDLERSGITDEVAKATGMLAVADARRLDSTFKRRAAIAIPYHDPRTGEQVTWNDGGTLRPFERVRYLGKEPRGFLPSPEKPQRYAQPAGSPVCAYFPRSTGIDWPAVLDNPKISLVITEGEKKAVAACEADISTIALGGVDCFQNKGAFLPELEAIAWQGRQVITCYDSDRASNPRVQAAEKRLAQELRRRGAIVLVATIPVAEDGSKLGLDDYIVRYGGAAAIEMLATAALAPDKPVIDLAPARLVENLVALDGAFVASGLRVYQRSGRVVYVENVGEMTNEDDIRRAGEAPTVREMTAQPCQQFAMRAATFQRWNERKKGALPTECSPDLAKHYLSKVGGWRLPELQAIVEAPTIRPDGTLLQSPGYDAALGILYWPSGEFPTIPEAPTQDDARATYAELCDVVRGFEFASPEAQATWVAAALTGLVRPALRTAPLFAFSAPVMGAGKTLAADLVSIIATGHEPAVMSQGHNPEEDAKQLLAVLMRGDLIVQIDNCEHPIEGDALCAILTSPSYQGRILGRSEMVTVPTNALFLATGNNMQFKGDMSTRALLCRIVPEDERPEERKFDWDARVETRELRPKLIKAALTIIRAYHVAGCPDVGAKPFGRFEDWQRFVQCPLIWAGAPDPCMTRELVEQNDPDRASFERLVSLWSEVFGIKPTPARDFTKLTNSPEAHELYELACELSGDTRNGILNIKAFGEYLASKEDRATGGWRLTKGEDKKHKVATWRLSKV